MTEQEVSIRGLYWVEADVEVLNDLVFEQTEDEIAYIIDEASLHKIAYQHKKNKESISKKSGQKKTFGDPEPTEHSDVCRRR
jgi:hypothetical protein